jgi:hypothetical protein
MIWAPDPVVVEEAKRLAGLERLEPQLTRHSSAAMGFTSTP